MMLNKVDFPAPLGPIRPVMDFGATSKEHRSTARIPPKAFSTAFTVNKGLVAKPSRHLRTRFFSRRIPSGRKMISRISKAPMIMRRM